MGKLIGVRETARRLGIHENTVRNWADSGILPPAARDPYRKFDAGDVERVRAAREAGPQHLQDQLVRGVAGILVRLRLPPGMTPGQAVRAVEASVGFGQPAASLQYVIPDKPSGHRRRLSR